MRLCDFTETELLAEIRAKKTRDVMVRAIQEHMDALREVDAIASGDISGSQIRLGTDSTAVELLAEMADIWRRQTAEQMRGAIRRHMLTLRKVHEHSLDSHTAATVAAMTFAPLPIRCLI